MYERCSEPARRAIFVAIVHSRLQESLVVDSEHLLMALIHEEFRSNTLFHLQEHFPLYCGCPCKFAKYQDAPSPEPVLTDDMKRVLARTLREADAIRDYWIDTEHLILGILVERKCLAARYLYKTGLSLKTARQIVISSRASRPEYGPVSQWWGLQSPLEWLLFKWRLRKYQKEIG